MKKMTRIYQAIYINKGDVLDLNQEAATHLIRVLRMRPEDTFILFNGTGYEYECRIINSNKRKVQVKVLSSQSINRESPLKIHLYQAISKGERMEFAIQKAVELGVTQITPISTEHSVLKLDQTRLEKKHTQWKKIIVSACEQSGRNILPTLNPLSDFSQAVSTEAPNKLILHPTPQANPLTFSNNEPQSFHLYIGPEGGFSAPEIEQALNQGAIPWQLGCRILRTETAALTALSILQHHYGDLMTD